MKKLILIFTAVLLLASCTTTKYVYNAEYYYEWSSFSPDEPFENRLSCLCLKRSDGRYWTIDLGTIQTNLNLEATLGEMDNGFYLVYKQEYGGESFFFKELHGEPSLYEIETTFFFEGISATTSRKITPPIKISKLTVEQICSLIEKEDLEK